MPLITGTNNGETLTGTSGDDQIEALGGDDVLIGAGGNDTTDGGTGNDQHYVESPGDIVIELDGEGDDRVLAGVSYALGAGVYVETLTTDLAVGSAAIDLTGNELAQSIYGNSGDNILDGGGGDDFLVGLGGSDTYIVDSQSDRVAEAAGQGDDEVITSVSYALADGAWVETLRTNNAASAAALTLSGNEVANSIYANAGANILYGGGGNDYLVALEGNDYLIGGPGSDVLMGGLGNDIYVADFSIIEGQDSDVVLENPGEGDDVLATSGDFVLREGLSIETMVALGSEQVSLYGNEIGNSIYGNDANNILAGGAGNDYLVGGGGDDRLHGDSGSDVLQGGTGDDRYGVDNVSDQIVELPGEGMDSVSVTGDYFRLAPGVEVETIRPINESSPWQTLTFIGNEFANTIFGNNATNYIHDGGGADILIGQQGDDYYYVSDPSTQIVEGQLPGVDRVFTSTDFVLAEGAIVEFLSTYWQYGDEPLGITGNEVSQTLVGNFGSNVLDGKLGEDILIGLGGSDTFAFTVLGGSATILDFQPGIDKIALSQAIFDTLAPGGLDLGAFAIGSAATEPDVRIVYDPTTGFLSYDADGSGAGAADYFAILAGAPQLSATDFVII